MPKPVRPLQVDIPRPESDRPAWSRVGIIGLAGFLFGIAWPRFAGVRIGPSVPDSHVQAEGAPAPSASGSAGAVPLAPSAVGTSVAAPAPEPPLPSTQELVLVGSGRILRCWDKRDKKIDDCEKLQFDPIAVQKLKELSKCPSAMGLEGKMQIGFELNFEKKQVSVVRTKKGTTLPSSTVAGIVGCAGHEFGNVDLEDVPHKYRRYSLSYGLTFYPPGKHPENADAAEKPADTESDAGSTTSETEASGSAVVSVDSAPLRKEPKGSEKVGRLVRGTKVKIVGRQNDWYKVDSGSKTGWVYRSAIGL